MPQKIHSDPGREFVNQVITDMCKLLCITKSQTTAYHPQGNAYAEVLHKFLKKALHSKKVNLYYLKNKPIILGPILKVWLPIFLG